MRLRDNRIPVVRDASNPWDDVPAKRDIVAGILEILFALCMFALIVWGFLLHTNAACAQEVPRAAQAYRADLMRTARAVWGMDAPIATFAAQVHQESGWNPRAVSHVGAAGLSQFMPATATWIAGMDPVLADAQPFNTGWALRAMVVYDRHLFELAPARFDARDRMWVALRAYNGGMGHWQAEARSTGLRTPTRDQVDAACGNARRAKAHCAENLGYPHRILIVLQPRYAAWGPTL